ncbi:DUF86 domain-containing protein [Tuberibacillus sp. Marseille-P3662]|uniref:DUF86 domain-containing protein n=1 Tax=Tuberibacillus sp. Marseille-P3662 TaxID=1965358 RepID=UPI000A1C8F63|nr:DUF86 domain-containing protein [Tuberibacillus sp. Marseille-P3662]
MYFVDRETIEEKAAYIEQHLMILNQYQDWSGKLEQLALERMAHTLIEAVIDIGNQMIDGFIMRDPGSYGDIIDILTDEQVIDGDSQDALKRLLTWRKSLVQAYQNINGQELAAAMYDVKPFVERFPQQVRRYLEKELGPISAFMPKSHQHESEEQQ